MEENHSEGESTLRFLGPDVLAQVQLGFSLFDGRVQA